MYGQLVAFVFALVSTAAVVTTNFWNQWVVSGPESSSLAGPIWAWKGIWADCIQYYGGQYYCEEQKSLFLELAHINAIRGMMSTATVFAVFSTFAFLIGMECSKLLDDHLQTKRKIMRFGGVLHLFAGALTLASVSWYASIVHYDFFSFGNQDNFMRYEFGAALYLGFVSAFLSFITGLLCICMPGPLPEKSRYDNSVYPFTKAASDHLRRETHTKDKYMEYV